MPAPLELPRSLVSPEAATAVDRRARVALNTADFFAPVASADTPGFATRGARWLHLMWFLPDAGSTLTWQLWLYDQASDRWAIRTDIGINGDVEMAAADVDNPRLTILDIGRAARVWVRVKAVAGFAAGAAGADLWLSGVSDQA